MASIVKRGKNYRAQVSVAKYGNNEKLTKTFKSKKEAEIWAQTQELHKAKGLDISAGTILFKDYYSHWIELIKRKEVREATFQNYLNTGKMINENFNDLKLKDLSDLNVQFRIDEYGLTHSKKTTNEHLLKIKACIRDAFARGYIPNDFSSLVRVRGYTTKKRNRALSISDFKKLKQHLLNNTDDLFNIQCLVALETGMRRGEILGVRKEDLFADGNQFSINIRRSISPTSKDLSLKTDKAYRNISINRTIFDILNNLTPFKDGYIFNIKEFQHSAKLKKLLKQLGIQETTFHGLRDTHASFLFSKEIDIAYISQRLGHESITTTQNYYLSLMPEKKHQQDADALKLLDSL